MVFMITLVTVSVVNTRSAEERVKNRVFAELLRHALAAKMLIDADHMLSARHHPLDIV